MSKLVLVASLLALVVRGSKANSITYNLSTPNSSVSAYSQPFGTITVTWDNSTMATITFTANSLNGDQYLFGGNGAVAVNVNGSYTLGPVTETAVGTGFSPDFKSNVPGTEAGFGSFNLSLNNQGGFPGAAGAVSFTITDKSGNWANASSVLTANSLGYFVAAHVYVTALPANASNGAINTGYGAGNTPNRPVPDAGLTIMMLGSALASLGIVGCRFHESESTVSAQRRK